jgi:hypothetical protein
MLDPVPGLNVSLASRSWLPSVFATKAHRPVLTCHRFSVAVHELVEVGLTFELLDQSLDFFEFCLYSRVDFLIMHIMCSMKYL